MTNNAVKLLFEYLTSKFENLKYILTYRLNQDVLEHFFGALRSKGGLYDHPSTLEFRYRLRNYILGKNQGPLCEGANVENTTIDDSEIYDKNALLSGKHFSKLSSDIPEEDDVLLNEDDFIKEGVNEEINELKYDALEHLTGYICHKTKLGASEASESSFTWTDQLSEGGLIKPPQQLVQKMQELEKIFHSVNGNTISIQSNYLKNLLNLSSNIDCDELVKKTFFRSRMYFRIKKLNECNLNAKKRKYSKILT